MAEQAVNTPVQDEDEFYDDATAAFPSVDDLVPGADNGLKAEMAGRLVAIWALENGTSKGEQGPYGWTQTITVVLDDGPEGGQISEQIGTTKDGPVRLELRHSTSGIHARLRPRVEGVNAKGVKLKYRPMLGRVNARPSTKYKKGSPAFSIAEPTDSDREIVKKHKDYIIALNRELEAKDVQASDDKAFD